MCTPMDAPKVSFEAFLECLNQGEHSKMPFGQYSKI